MAIGNIDSVSSMLARMTPQQRQQFAVMHKDDPIMVSLAKFVNDVEQEKAQAMRNQQLMQRGPMPTVVDQEVMAMAPPQAQPMLPEEVGIGALPAPNMERMAGGGITGEVEHYAEGDLVGTDRTIANLLALDPDFDEEGNPRSKQESAFIRQRQADAQRAKGRREIYSAELAATPSTALVERMEKYYKPRRTPGSKGGETPEYAQFRAQLDEAVARGAITKEQADLAFADAKSRGIAAPTGRFVSQPAAPAAPSAGGIAALAPATTPAAAQPAQPAAPAEPAAPAAVQAAPAFTPASAEEMGAQARELASAQNKESEAAYAPFRALFEKQAADLESRGERNKAEAILQAGLAMMAGRSPYALANIGEGGMKGLAAYQEAQKQDEAARRGLMQSQVALMQAQRAERSGNMRDAVALMNQARQEKQFAISSANQAEQIKNTRDYQQGSLEVQRQQAAAAAAQKDAYARLVDARIKALEAPEKDKARAMQEWGKLQAKVLDSLKTDTTYLALKPEQQAAYRQRKLREEMGNNPFLSQYLFTAAPTGGTVRTLTEKDDEQD